MEQTFTKAGLRLPVTVVKSGPSLITWLRSESKDGYFAAQLGFGTRKTKNTSKPILGHLQKALKNKEKLPRFLKEVRLDDTTNLTVGQEIKPSEVLKPGDLVQVTGVSKGKGFAGVVKRWGFAGGPKTHGQSDRHRAPGAIGQRQTPGRVYKGKRMAGRMGGGQVTIKNLVVLSIDESAGQIKLSGPVPGARGNLLILKKTGQVKTPIELFDTPEPIEEPAAGESTEEQKEKKNGSQE